MLTSNDSDLYLRRDFDDTAPTQIIMTSTTMDFWTNSTAKKFMMESDLKNAKSAKNSSPPTIT